MATDERAGLRLGIEQERRLRMWPKDRIRPKSVALGVISLLAEVVALRQERAEARRRLAAVVGALEECRAQVHMHEHGGYAANAVSPEHCDRWVCGIANRALAGGAGEGETTS